jgi:hypothetical protein
MKIHIDIKDDIDPVIALDKVTQVIQQGRVSKNNTLYCYLTVFEPEKIAVVTRDYRKSDCFVVYKTKRKTS